MSVCVSMLIDMWFRRAGRSRRSVLNFGSGLCDAYYLSEGANIKLLDQRHRGCLASGWLLAIVFDPTLGGGRRLCVGEAGAGTDDVIVAGKDLRVTCVIDTMLMQSGEGKRPPLSLPSISPLL